MMAIQFVLIVGVIIFTVVMIMIMIMMVIITSNIHLYLPVDPSGYFQHNRKLTFYFLSCVASLLF